MKGYPSNRLPVDALEEARPRGRCGLRSPFIPHARRRARRPVDEMVDVYQHRAKEIWLPHRNRDRLVVGGVTLNGGGKYESF